MTTEKLSEVLSEVNSVIDKLNIDIYCVNENYGRAPMLTYYTLMDMARYCQKFSQKLELLATEYKSIKDEGEDK